VERRDSLRVGLGNIGNIEEADVDVPHLPNIRVIAVPIAPVVIAGNVGSQLRAHYADLLNQPVPEHLDKIVQRLS
jgi:Anti-sigma factor NepR